MNIVIDSEMYPSARSDFRDNSLADRLSTCLRDLSTSKWSKRIECKTPGDCRSDARNQKPQTGAQRAEGSDQPKPQRKQYKQGNEIDLEIYVSPIYCEKTSREAEANCHWYKV